MRAGTHAPPRLPNAALGFLAPLGAHPASAPSTLLSRLLPHCSIPAPMLCTSPEFFIFIFFLMFGRGKSFSAIFPERVKVFWVRPTAVAGFVCFACNACGFFFRVICGRLG